MEPRDTRLELIAEIVEDERQLDGSRHIELVGAVQPADLALRLVVTRDGVVQEAELHLKRGETWHVVTFDRTEPNHPTDMPDDDRSGLFTMKLHADGVALSLDQRDDGDIALSLQLEHTPEVGT